MYDVYIVSTVVEDGGSCILDRNGNGTRWYLFMSGWEWSIFSMNTLVITHHLCTVLNGIMWRYTAGKAWTIMEYNGTTVDITVIVRGIIPST